MSARIIWWISLGGIVFVLIMAIVAIVCLTAVAVHGGLFPQVVPAVSPPPAGTQAQTASTPTLSSAAELTVSIAERNTAWATYVVTAVGVLFTVVAIVTTLTNEIRSSRMEDRWAHVEPELTQAIADAVNGVRRLEEIEQGMYRTVVPMAEFMVSNALIELMYSDPAAMPENRRAHLRRTVCEGVRLLVEQEPSYARKESAVRRLVKIADAATLRCLDAIETGIRQFEPCEERDALFEVVHETRMAIKAALRSGTDG